MRAFRALLWKEWVSLRPFALLLLALFVFGLFLTQSTEYFDVYPIWDNALTATESVVTVTFILCVVVSMGLLVREKDEGTLLYLDGLPLSRFSIYATKWLVAVGLITAINLLWTVEGIAYELLSRGSASPPPPWRSIVVFAMLQSFLGVYFLTLLIALSFLRIWSLIALGAIFWIIFWLNSLQVPYVELLDPFALLKAPAEIGETWQWPRQQLFVMSGIAFVAWMGGYGIFSLRTGFAGAFAQGMKEAWWGKLIGAGAVILALVIWLGILTAISWEEGSELAREEAEAAKRRPAPPEGGNQILTDESDRFHFIYRKRSERRMQKIIPNADPVFERTAGFLEAPEEMPESRITVDLSSPLASHNAGQAYWKKIRMALPPKQGKSKNKGAGESEALAILGHEVSHVLTDQITQGRLEESFESARWFHEGLASYVEFRFFRDDAEAPKYRRWVALASLWDEVHFTEMVDNGHFSSRRDPFLAYPAGYLWVDSLVRVYGDEAPAKLLRAIGREGGPRKLSGLGLWRDACLAAGFDLERVRSDFRSQLQALREKYREELAPFPEIASGRAVRRGGRVVIRPDLPVNWDRDLPEGAELICRVRPRTDALPTQWRYSKLGEDLTFEVPSLHFLAAGIGFQVGWKIDGTDAQPVFGEWVNVTVGTSGDDPESDE